MSIDEATNDREFVRVRCGEKRYVLVGKHWLLEAGAVTLLNDEFAGGFGQQVEIPGRGFVDDVLTDAVMVAIARRGMTGRNQMFNGEYVIDIAIPTHEEAFAELRSGSDIYGGTWNVPVFEPTRFSNDP